MNNKEKQRELERIKPIFLSRYLAAKEHFHEGFGDFRFQVLTCIKQSYRMARLCIKKGLPLDGIYAREEITLEGTQKCPIFKKPSTK